MVFPQLGIHFFCGGGGGWGGGWLPLKGYMVKWWFPKISGDIQRLEFPEMRCPQLGVPIMRIEDRKCASLMMLLMRFSF